MRWTFPLLFFFSLLLLSACVQTFGSPQLVDYERFTRLEENKSRKNDVYALYGQPHQVSYSSDKSEIGWHYYYIGAELHPLSATPLLNTLIAGMDTRVLRTSFIFDETSVLRTRDRNFSHEYKNHLFLTGDIFTKTTQPSVIRAEMEASDLPFDKKSAKHVSKAADIYAN